MLINSIMPPITINHGVGRIMSDNRTVGLHKNDASSNQAVILDINHPSVVHIVTTSADLTWGVKGSDDFPVDMKISHVFFLNYSEKRSRIS